MTCYITLHAFDSIKFDRLSDLLHWTAPFASMMFRSNAVKAIETLMSKKGRFDYIILETTGLADPGEKHFSDVANYLNALYALNFL